MAKSSKIRRSAQGQECQIRIPGVCNGNPETTVLAHLAGGGMSGKRGNHEGAYACSKCHDVVDSRLGSEHSKQDILLWHMEGVFRTQNLLIQAGLIIINE